MRQSKLFIPTIKEVPSNAEIKSHKLLLKAGYIQQTAAGIYTYLPMATKVLLNIEKIIREELNNIDANEVRLPFLEPSELWEKSGRWNNYGAELFRVEDRHNRFFALAPTHEEVATDIVKNYLNSYKKFPMNIYQIQTKMRDERRPRFGLLRGREFIMMDGYAFARNEEEFKEIYDNYYNAYKKIFQRLGLNIKAIAADNGSMGGAYSHEFMAISEVGEDFIAVDDNLEMAYNIEVAPVNNKYREDQEEILPSKEIATPNITKIEELINQCNLNSHKILKAVCYNIDEQLVICFVMGLRNVEETKVLNLVKGQNIEPANEELLIANGLIPGFIGPDNLNSDIKVLFDREVFYKKNLIVGANKKDTHLENFNFSSKENLEFVDIRSIESGDYLDSKSKPIKIVKGIEIGHIFALGTKYTEALDVKYLDENQKTQIPTMGSFGIGVSRILGAITEQSNMEEGIIFNNEVAPYKVHLIPLDYGKDVEQTKYTDDIIQILEENNISYLLDDRVQRPGSKFKDADLIGIPYHIVIGRRFKEDIVEFKDRIKEEKLEISQKEILEKLNN